MGQTGRWIMRKSGGFGSSVGLAFLLASSTALAQSDVADTPDPELDPSEVVQIQLDALRHNDDPFPDAGIAELFTFTSPTNRTESGPLPRFADMVHTTFGEMLNHREAHLLPLAVKDGTALQPVELIGKDGSIYRYVFVLTRQADPPYRGCWMTDSVIGDPYGPQAPPRDQSI